jgi:hypothetical protein
MLVAMGVIEEDDVTPLLKVHGCDLPICLHF